MISQSELIGRPKLIILVNKYYNDDICGIQNISPLLLF